MTFAVKSLLIYLVLRSEFASSCTATYSVQGQVLRNHTIKTETADKIEDCIVRCMAYPGCKSSNFYRVDKSCELNDKTHASHPEDMRRELYTNYMINTLRSIPCKTQLDCGMDLICTPSLICEECRSHPLGMESRAIPNSAVAASSTWRRRALAEQVVQGEVFQRGVLPILCGRDMATLNSMRCDAQTTRRLVEREAGQLKNIDQLDSCGEVTLGLTMTFGCTLVIWILGLNFFDMVGMQWIRSWETHAGWMPFEDFQNEVYSSYSPGEDGVPKGAWDVLDVHQGGSVSERDLKVFMTGLRNPIQRPEQVKYSFQGLDLDQDGFIQQSEWNKAFIHSTFFYHKTTTLSTTTLATTQRTTVPHTVITVTEPPPIVVDRATLHKFVGEMVKRMGKEGQHSAEQAFGALDLNGDGYAARGELLNALGQLREPMRGQDARVVFQGVDANEDGVVEFPEFKAAFEYAREHEGDGTEPHKPATRTNPGEENVEVKVAPPQEQNDNPRLAKVLQEMRLNEPPISMARFVHGMGSVPAETAFKALDANQDNELSQDEMVRFAKAFVPPLTQTEALFAHKGMDINDDGRVVPAEMYDTLRFGHFFTTEEQAREMHE